eukprot:30400-Pelagococcus_subviridis.AAC.4
MDAWTDGRTGGRTDGRTDGGRRDGEGRRRAVRSVPFGGGTKILFSRGSTAARARRFPGPRASVDARRVFLCIIAS